MVRAFVAGACALASGMALMSSVTPAVAAAPAHLTATATPSTVLTHATFFLSGSVTPRGPGVITVQQYVGGHWKQIGHKSASPSGSYSFALRAPGVAGTTIYRTTRPGSKTFKTLLSPTVHVHATTSAFTVTATTHSPVAAGSPVKVTGSVAKHTSGFVALESLVKGAWKPVATGRLTSASTYAFSHVLPVGHYQLRVRKPATTTTAAGVSKTLGVTVSAAPTTSVTLAGTLVSPGVYSGKVTVTVHTVATAGVKSTTYVLDGAPAKTYTGPVAVNASGAHNFKVTVTDKLNRKATASRTWSSQPAVVDNTPPHVTVALTGTHTGSAYTGNVTVTITATDTGGSGVKSISYSLDGVAHGYTGPFTVSASGSHNVTAAAEDNAGNFGTPTPQTTTWTQTTVDTTPPVVHVTLTGTLVSAGVYAGAVTVTVTATDPGSGVKSTNYTLDGVLHNYTGPFSVSSLTSHTLTATATDNQNNVGDSGPATHWSQQAASGTPGLVVSSDDQAALLQSTPRLVFATFRGDTRVIAAKSFTFTNNGDAALQVQNIAIGGTDAGSYRLATGQATSLNIPAGGSATVSVEFHPTDPTGCEDAAHPVAIGTVNRNATLNYSTNSASQPSGSAALSGIYACSAGGNAEPVLDQVLQGLGYTDNVYNGFDRRYIGPSRWIGNDEIISPYFTAADPSQPVSLVPVAHYGSGNASNAYQTTGWYAKGSAMATGSSCSAACNKLWQFPADSLNASNEIVYNQNQKLLPSILPGGTTTFSPSGAFGIFSSDFSEVNFTDDSLNTAHSTANVDLPASSMHYLHQMRIYPARQANGSIIPNTYLIGDDLSRVPPYKNNDYQDVVLLLSNVNPAVAQGPTIGASTSLNLAAGGSVSGSCSVTGFDGVMANTGGTECNSGNIAFTGGGLRLTSSAGQLADHNQQNALYKTFDAARGAFTVKARVIGPVNQLTGNYQQIGAFFGPDQNNFVKVEAEHNGSGTDPHVTMFFSEKGVAGTVGTVSVPGLTSASTLDLIIKGNTNVPDPIAGASDTYGVHGFPLDELEVFYSIDGGTPVQVGTIKEPADVTGWFSRQAKAGILVANPQASSFNATFSSFAITNGW